MRPSTEQVGTRPAPVADDARISTRAWVVFAAVSVCSFQTALALSITNVAFPDLRDDFPTVSQAALSWVLNLYTIVAGAALVVAGVAVERLGRKRMLAIGAAGFALASLACALAPNVGLLLVARIVQALASALVTPSSVALIVREFPDSHRATAVAWWSAVGSVAASIGPVLGGVLVDAGGWRWAFAAMVPGGALGVVLVLAVVGESRDPETRPLPDPAGAAMIVVAVGLVIGGLVQSRPWGWEDPRVPGAIVLGLVVLGVLVVRSRRHRAPILDTELFRHRSFSVANLGSFVFGTGFFAVFFGYVLFLTDVWDRSARTAGLLMTPLAVCGAVLSPLAGRHVRRHGVVLPFALGGALVTAGGLVLLVFAEPEPSVAGVWLPALFLTGAGAGLVWPCLFVSVVADIPRERYAVATGINQTVQRASTAFGVALAVTLLGPTGDLAGIGHFDRLFVLSTLCGLGTIALAPLLRPRPHRRRRPAR